MNIRDFIGGWFVGDFIPTIHSTKDFEIGIKSYKKGDTEPTHKHNVVTEISIVINGKVKMKEVMNEGDICVLRQEFCPFEALEDSVMVVVKIPSIPDDKEFKDKQ